MGSNCSDINGDNVIEQFEERVVQMSQQRRVVEFQQNQLTNLVYTSNSFGMRIYESFLRTNDATKNVVFSPSSLASALYMLLEGADGETYSEIIAALGQDARRSLSIADIERGIEKLAEDLPLHADGYTLNIANSMWTAKGHYIEREFKEKLIKVFHAVAKDVDFQIDGTDKINEWCDSATNHSIPKLFNNPLDPDTVLVLINAIFFKGVWKTQFDAKMTHPRRFFSSPSMDWNTAPRVPMMTLVDEFPLVFNEELQFQLIALPYENDEVVMYVLLPEDDVPLRDVETRLTYKILMETVQKLQKVKVDVSLPKFKLNSELSLIRALNGVGIHRAFSDLANLSKITSGPLMVNKVIQKAVIEVNEQGTVASAITGVQIMSRSMKIRHKIFNANHPFMFFIEHVQTKIILFAGRVTEP